MAKSANYDKEGEVDRLSIIKSRVFLDGHASIQLHQNHRLLIIFLKMIDRLFSLFIGIQCDQGLQKILIS